MDKKDYEFASNILKEIPDVRKEKVEEMKEKIKNGYRVNTDKFVEKLLNSKK